MHLCKTELFKIMYKMDLALNNSLRVCCPLNLINKSLVSIFLLSFCLYRIIISLLNSDGTILNSNFFVCTEDTKEEMKKMKCLLISKLNMIILLRNHGWDVCQNVTVSILAAKYRFDSLNKFGFFWGGGFAL